MRQISNLEHYRILRSENSILLFFTKLLKNLEKQTYISLLLELMSNWIDMCLGIWKPEAMVTMPSLLTGSTMISTCSTFQSCGLNITDQPVPLVFLTVTKKFDIATHTHTKKSTTCHAKKKKKNVVNSSQSNDTTENYLHIASITIILNNGYLILKIYVMH